MNIIAFLPCRAGSERVPFKNTKPFAGVQGGLLHIKIKQLLEVPSINRILLSTNDSKVIEIAESFKDKKILIDRRPESLATSSTSTDDLINYVPSIIEEGHVLWTHVTSPFLNSQQYTKAINIYLKVLEEGTYDSVMAVNKVQTFLWNEEGSLNYDSKVEKWPRTQTLKPIYEINSGFFINSVSNYLKYQNRIGLKPYLFNCEKISSFDIDWPDDFLIGEQIFKVLNQ